MAITDHNITQLTYEDALRAVAKLIDGLNPGQQAKVIRHNLDVDRLYFTVSIRPWPESPASARRRPKARATDPATSKLAALRNEPRRDSQRWRIIMLLVADSRGKVETPYPGLTANRIAAILKLPLNSVSTRMSECERGGWIAARGTVEQDGAERTLYVPEQRAVDLFASKL